MNRTVLPTATALAFALASSLASPGETRPGGVVQIEHRDPLAMPSVGPANALVTVELFFAPFQSSKHAIVKYVERLQASHPSRIRLVYRLVSSGGQARLAPAAIYAFSEGKFFEFMDAVNALRMLPDDKALAEIAKKIGLDPDTMFAVINNPPASYRKALADNELRRVRRLRGSPPPPNVLFNGHITQTQSTALGMADLEREYQTAKDDAEDLLDHGIAPSDLAATFDSIPPPVAKDIIIQPGATDEGLDDPGGEPALASPPLHLEGWPSFGSPNPDTTIVVLCSPTSQNCRAAMTPAKTTALKYPTQVRVVWAPFFDVSDEEAADLSLLSDAALCAEKVGTTLESKDSPFDDDASPGWRWVEAVLSESSSRRRDFDPEKMIDKVAARLSVDRPAFATCRAQLAGTSIRWIEAARHAGVKVTPGTVVGGRVYGPVIDYSTLQLLVDAELAPGWLSPSWMHADEK